MLAKSNPNPPIADASQVSRNGPEAIISKEQLRDMGLNDLVYVQEVAMSHAKKLFPQVEEFPEQTALYAVHAANGTPILLAEDLESAVIAATDHELNIQYVQ